MSIAGPSRTHLSVSGFCRYCSVIAFLALTMCSVSQAIPFAKVVVTSVPISLNECRARIAPAYAKEGYQTLGGDFGNGWLAGKGNRLASISCIHPAGATETTVQIEVATDKTEENTVMAEEVAQLKADMTGPTAQLLFDSPNLTPRA